MEDKENTKSKVALREEEILKFWKENKIFEKSLAKPSPEGEFVFYDGPVTANSKPVLHTIEPFAFKDLIPRYKTMQGFHVARKGGWDTHGLPVELQIEKKLGFKSKKDIENYGIATFNKLCKESVWEYIGLWQAFTDRIGYWADQKNPYVTYHNSYIESVWSILKYVNERDLVYKDYKVVPWCPRCGTALSSHELAQGYETVKDLSVTAKFKLLPDQKFGENGEFVTGQSAYLLAWTTTPWTLPGNVTLAVNEKISYSAVRIDGIKELLILSTDLVSKVLDGHEVEVVHTFKGEGLLNLQYEPLYDFFPKETVGLEKAYKVYAADFVNTEDGTGIVHTAVMYGQEDFELGTKVGLPKYHLVNEDGTFKEGMDFLSGLSVGVEETAVEIIKDLAHRGLLFKKEKYEHQYPHCWRCKTRLIYYARDSWYIKMSSLREELVKENEGINWVPEHIKEGRFGEWLREVKDWAISRERYWGAPLPVWVDEKGKPVFIGSISELKEKTKKSGNKYFAMRHGESEKNAQGILNHDLRNVFHLTEKGREMVKESVKELKDKKIDLIISSPFHRCKETAEIIRENLKIKEEIVVDNALWELKKGPLFEGKTLDEYHRFFANTAERFEKAPEGGETLLELNRRVGDFLYDLENKYKNKNILIVSHMATITALRMVSESLTLTEDIRLKEESVLNPDLAEVVGLDFTSMPHNENYELDLHKPFIDEIKLEEEGKELTRVKEVLDVWFDSGSMPFASVAAGYPADFISEAIDQTRGWFYTLHAIGILMNKGKAYKNVICLGHILDSEGKKMSKSIGNIVDPNMAMAKHGVDALRLWMYSVNQPGDSKNFDEKTVEELQKKVFNPLENILAFYKLYSSVESHNVESHNVLDRWIISKLNELFENGTKNLDNYRIFEASRSIRDFANDFSTWYLRRSRDRFKSEITEDKNAALATTRFILLELSKFMAPFTPFFAEYLYRELKSENDPESVHLTEWPKVGEVDKKLLEDMELVRDVVSQVLMQRNEQNIKVRQPLNLLKIQDDRLKGRTELVELIKDEVNIKEVVFDKMINGGFELDIKITEELKTEGEVREFIRAVQELRKEKNLTPDQKIVLEVETSEEGQKFLESNKTEISKPTNISDFKFSPNSGSELEIGNFKLKIHIK